MDRWKNGPNLSQILTFLGFGTFAGNVVGELATVVAFFTFLKTKQGVVCLKKNIFEAR